MMITLSGYLDQHKSFPLIISGENLRHILYLLEKESDDCTECQEMANTINRALKTIGEKANI